MDNPGSRTPGPPQAFGARAIYHQADATLNHGGSVNVGVGGGAGTLGLALGLAASLAAATTAAVRLPPGDRRGQLLVLTSIAAAAAMVYKIVKQP